MNVADSQNEEAIGVNQKFNYTDVQQILVINPTQSDLNRYVKLGLIKP